MPALPAESPAAAAAPPEPCAPRGASALKRIVLTTFGSFGDLHPYMALAKGLLERGHDATIATSAAYRQKIEAEGIGFAPVRPDHPDWKNDPGLMRRLMDMRTGSE